MYNSSHNMPWFIIIFFGLYSALHGYFFWKVRCAFGPLGLYRYALAAVLLFFLFAPLLVRWLESHGWLQSAKAVGVAGYLWMPAIFWFCIFAGLADLWNFSLQLAGVHRVLIPARMGFCAACLTSIVLLLWGLHEAADIQLREVTIQSSRMPRGSKPLRIVAVSDMHLGLHAGKQRVRRALELIQQARPDVLLSLGDLNDSPLEDIPDFARAFDELHPPMGKFAILGNHEYYIGVEASEKFHQACGFRLLRGEARIVDGVRFVGVDDRAGLRMNKSCAADDRPLLCNQPPAPRATILLKHQPFVTPECVGEFDLQVSGHTHGGQIFPFHFVVMQFMPYFSGLYDLGKGSQLYVSRGTGAWGPPVRFLAPPEVTVINMVPASQ